MSAYKRFDTIQFLNAGCLVKALKEMGYAVEFGKALHLYGYEGKARPETAQIVVRRQHIGHLSNDLGFAWNGQAFVPIISEYDAGSHLDQKWRDKLQQTYSRFAVLELLEAKNACPQQSVVLNDGTIALRVQMEV